MPTEAKEQVEILCRISNVVSSNLSLERVFQELVSVIGSQTRILSSLRPFRPRL
jgi:hypothetical protein